jgi:hypothetical protein
LFHGRVPGLPEPQVVLDRGHALHGAGDLGIVGAVVIIIAILGFLGLR